MRKSCLNDGTEGTKERTKIECTIKITPQDLFYPYSTGSASNKTAYDNLFLDQGVCGDKSKFFIQVPCLIPPDQRVPRKIDGLMFGSLIVFVYLFVVIYFDYIKCIALNTYVDWDVKSITAGDYSVEFDLKIETWEKF